MQWQPNTVEAFKYCIALLFFFITRSATAQNVTIAAIEKALNENNPGLAFKLVQQQIDFYYAARQPDSLNNYVFYTGKIAEQKSNTNEAIQQVEALVQKIKTLSLSPATLQQTYLAAGEFYGFAGKNNLAYKANGEAFHYALQVNNDTWSQLALVQNNLSTYAQRMGNVSLSQHHTRLALRYLSGDKNPDLEILYNAYNGMGNTMWYASKLDSSLYFFNQALQALKKTKPSILNRYYRPAVIQNNLAGIYGVQGKPTEAIKAMKACIANLKLFISSKEPHIKKNSALSFQFEATDNLAGIYKEIGDYKQAHDLLLYSYQQKQKNLGDDDPAVFISQILLGQLYYAMKDFDKALQFLNSGLDRIAKADGDYLFWQADACNTLALLYGKKGDAKQAAFFYEKADGLYEQSSGGEYDNIYLEFLRNAAVFYAENKLLSKALAKANKGYNYVTKTEGAASLLRFYQLLNLSEVYFTAGDYQQALNFSNKGLQVVNAIVQSSETLLDSIQVELKKPKALLLKAKSEYGLLPKKNSANLSAILTELKEALRILEQRKSVLQDPKDIALLIADHTELLAFIKELTLELYSLGHNEQYLDELISLHESGIYNRIRARLDKSGVAQFAYLPADVTQTEKTLKAGMVDALSSKGSHDQVMQAYIKSEEAWNSYLDQLRKQYPRYYKMRYASIFKSVKEVQSDLPSETSVVRYFFVGKNLLALVVDQQGKQLFRLSTTSLEENITAFSKATRDAKQSSEILYNLYQQVWAPLSKSIRYKRIIIVPDGILYNLSFEMLTPERINRFEELATKSLLVDYTVSYQYSLFLLGHQSMPDAIDQNFVAFAPGFSDAVKTAYQRARDSLETDNSYLSLLPQPFTISLASKTKNLLGGNAYLYEESTLNRFKNDAGHHKIIYVGTHAEADNLHPEFSKLIFAKDPANKDDNNSLYLFDIYNCDLNSNLTVLTACESGVPGYEDGEGMLSIAHAFSYAGSESIVTGLWKIDEQTSAVLMELFYKNLLKGLAKDEALRQAKLSYLAQSNGRALAPQYWSGLVLIGDTAPIQLKQNTGWKWWVVGGMAVLLTIVLIHQRRGLVRRKVF